MSIIKKTIIISLLSLSFAWAEENHEHTAPVDHKDHKNHDHRDTKASVQKIDEDKILIKVKGMVCAFCAQGIEKNFNKRDEVKKTKVDLDKMEVSIELNKGKTLDEKVIKEIVTSAGFSFEGIKK